MQKPLMIVIWEAGKIDHYLNESKSATWAQWPPGLEAALVEGLRRQFQQDDAGRCHLGAPGNAEEATWDSERGTQSPCISSHSSALSLRLP